MGWLEGFCWRCHPKYFFAFSSFCAFYPSSLPTLQQLGQVGEFCQCSHQDKFFMSILLRSGLIGEILLASPPQIYFSLFPFFLCFLPIFLANTAAAGWRDFAARRDFQPEPEADDVSWEVSTKAEGNPAAIHHYLPGWNENSVKGWTARQSER